MKASTARAWAWTLGLIGVALGVGFLVFLFLGRGTELPARFDVWGYLPVFDVVVNLGVPAIGILITTRRPENRLGWLFLVAGVVIGLGGFSQAWALYAIYVDPGSLPAPLFFAWLSNWLWPIPVCLLIFLFLWFPTGHLPSARWRPAFWLAVAVLAVLLATSIIFATAAWSTPFVDVEDVTGPLVGPALVGFSITVILLPVSIAVAVASLIVRFRRSTGEERLQLKWFVSAAALVAVTLTATLFLNTPLTALLFDVALLCLYVAIGIAILRYRLYDIDVIIGKAVVYGLLAAFITVVYVLVVVVIGAAIGATEGLSLVATAIVAIAFQPVRENARRTANRLVYGKRATPYEVLSGFSEQLGETYAGEELLPRMARLLAEGTGASEATVWLRVGSEMRPAARWPAGNGHAERSVRLAGDELPAFPEGETAVAVRHGRDLLGALTVAKPANEPLRPHEEQLVADLAAQAGLVLENFRLIEDLRSSRKRLVEAQDEERRRLERNIHDGAQQQLVALAVKVRLAEGLVGTDAERERDALRQILDETQETLENLRDLARGIYPPLLADRGLAAALESQARKCSVPVTVEADGLGRYPPEVEAAVYFCVLEALQNVAKYAEASHVRVLVREWEGSLDLSVMDDGRGFDRDTTPLGMGLLSMSDRLAAIGGTFDVKSRPGHGTNVVGRIPLAPDGR
ncbi:MAG TPA: histidine kinase [Actinomycetota bacterium]